MSDNLSGTAVINLIRPLFAAQQTQQGGFSRSIPATDDCVFTLVQDQVAVIQDMLVRTWIGHEHMLDFNERTTQRFHETLQSLQRKKRIQRFPS